MQARGTFSIKNWDEKPFAEHAEAPKLTHAEVINTYTGDLVAEGTVAHVMFYESDAHATYAGYERIVGTLNGRSGSFVVQSSGTFENGVATTTWQILPESTTGELVGLRGSGGYAARHERAIDYQLDYELP
jgi:Protein of unknown function (DUF3224)